MMVISEWRDDRHSSSLLLCGIGTVFLLNGNIFILLFKNVLLIRNSNIVTWLLINGTWLETTEEGIWVRRSQVEETQGTRWGEDKVLLNSCSLCCHLLFKTFFQTLGYMPSQGSLAHEVSSAPRVSHPQTVEPRKSPSSFHAANVFFLASGCYLGFSQFFAEPLASYFPWEQDSF